MPLPRPKRVTVQEWVAALWRYIKGYDPRPAAQAAQAG